MSDAYEYVTYETLDEGTIARIMLNQPKARNAQNRAMLVELRDAFLRAEVDDTVRVVIRGGNGPMSSSGHDLGSAEQREEHTPGRTSTGVSNSTAVPARAPRARCCRSGTTTSRTLGAGAPAQDHRRLGARRRVRRSLDADVVLRSDQP